MESCQTEGDGKLLCLCLRKEGLGISAKQLIPASCLYHPCCCYCLCGIRERVKECQRVPEGPSTAAAVTSALSTSSGSRISLAFCPGPALVPVPPNQDRPFPDNQEGTEECVGGDGGDSGSEGKVSECPVSMEEGMEGKEVVPRRRNNCRSRKRPCPLTTSPHTIPSVLKKPTQHHRSGPHFSLSPVFPHPTTPPLPLPALPAPRMPLASTKSLVLLHSVTNKRPNSGSSKSLNRLPLIFLRNSWPL